MKKRIMAVFGTRPEAIKMCPLIRTLRERNRFEVSVVVTGQHRSLLEEAMSAFGVSADCDWAVMREGQDLFELTERILSGARKTFLASRPDLVLVHGDTTTAFGTALAAFYLGIPVGHVEAGLRTYDPVSPFPEEWNRRAIGALASAHFAPTEIARKNLLAERVCKERIWVTGNTGIDALRYTVRPDFSHPVLDWVGEDRFLILTAHRRENQGEVMRGIFRGIRRSIEEQGGVRAVYPVHPSPEVRAAAEAELAECGQILLCEPLDPVSFHNLLARCDFCVSDSGGIQEEASSLCKPLLVLRDQTERPEAILAGGVRLIGRCEETVYRGVSNLLKNPALRYAMSQERPSPYGDGRASERIAEALESLFL